MDFILGLLDNVLPVGILDFVGRNFEWLAGLLGIPTLGAGLKYILDKFGAEDKFMASSRNRVASYNDLWFNKIIPSADKGVDHGKFVTQKMTGKFGSVYNRVLEIYVSIGLKELILGYGIGTLANAATFLTDYFKNFLTGLESDNN